jgi:hypothetical protein
MWIPVLLLSLKRYPGASLGDDPEAQRDDHHHAILYYEHV